jgi:hypothetical protein
MRFAPTKRPTGHPLRPGLLWLAMLVLVCTVGAQARAASLGTLTTFGDSYTQTKWYTVTTWAEQLRRAGAVSGLANYAKAGATAGGANNGRATFDGQLDEWQRGGGRLTRRTVVYFGYNDVNRRLDLAASGRAYAAGVDRLIRARANADGRRVLLALIHDWSRNPTGFPSQRARVDTWNRTVRNVARARGLRVVDLFTKINAVFRSPRSFNITNVTTPSRTNLGHLYFDGAHFGVRGQGIIAGTVRAALAP